jgi:hypothetical protein
VPPPERKDWTAADVEAVLSAGSGKLARVGLLAVHMLSNVSCIVLRLADDSFVHIR